MNIISEITWPVLPFFLNVLEKHKKLIDKATKKSKQKSIQKSDYIPPTGHVSLLKSGVWDEDDTKSCHLIFHNGVDWKHGTSWDFVEDWFCSDITWSSSVINTENLKHVQAEMKSMEDVLWLSLQEKKFSYLASDCTKVVHILCDKYTRGLAKMTNAKYLCPMCANYDPVTKKKRPKPNARRGVRRGT